MSPRLLLVDALNLIRRVYAAQPGTDGKERAAGARTSSVQSLQRALRECSPTHSVCVFDGGGASWRHELYPEYKAGHPPMPEALATDLENYRLAFAEISVASLSRAGLEADDVVATIATKAAGAGISALILSTDKIFLSLLPRGVGVRDHFRSKNFDEAHVEERFGVRPQQLVDLLALAGDPGNNIHGVPGVGTKTAADLLSRFGGLEATLSAAGDLEGKLGERLREYAETARLCGALLQLRTDLDLGINLNELRYLPDGG